MHGSRHLWLDNRVFTVILTIIKSMVVEVRMLMSKRFKGTKERVVAFCNACSTVCTSACRRDALLERVFVNGVRFL